MLNSTTIARSIFLWKSQPDFWILLFLKRWLYTYFFNFPKASVKFYWYCKAFKYMPNLMIIDIIGETKAFVPHAIFRQKSEVWHTMFSTAHFHCLSCLLLAELHDEMWEQCWFQNCGKNQQILAWIAVQDFLAFFYLLSQYLLLGIFNYLPGTY